MIDYKELSQKLLEALVKAEQHLSWCGYGDSYERDCAKDDKLPEFLESVIKEATELLKA